MNTRNSTIQIEREILTLKSGDQFFIYFKAHQETQPNKPFAPQGKLIGKERA
jgi:hypothetical protein